MTLALCLNAGEGLRQIVDQVLWVFQSDVQAHDRAGGGPIRSGARARHVADSRQALEPTPRGADAEQRQRVDKARGGLRIGSSEFE